MLDLIAMGRSSIDLYSRDVGARFEEITGFAAYVGGSPTNVAVGAARLGVRTGLLTAFGEDPVGDFIERFLVDQGVETSFIPRKPGRRTSAVLLGIQPPDRFPLVFYRDNCADAALTIDDVLAAPVDQARALFITGTGLSREPAASATILAAETACDANSLVVLDLDLRADQWHDPRAFGVMLRRVLPLCDVVIGTEEEYKALTLTDASQLAIEGSAVSNPTVEGDLDQAVELARRAVPAVVVKRGGLGSAVYTADVVCEVAAYPVEVLNILGAGDAFAAGLLCGRLQGLSWQESLALGNACGGIVVTRPGCADFMPTWADVQAFMEEQGRVG